MSNMIDLSNITPEQAEQLRAVLGITDTTAGARSPAWKPLKDMRPPTTAKGRLNRPHFEWSAEDDGHTVIKPFPRLMWDENGTERAVQSQEDMDTVPSSWMPYPPSKAALVDPMVRMQAEFDALSPDDQAFVLDAQRKARLNRLNEMMTGLSNADLASLQPKEVKPKK